MVLRKSLPPGTILPEPISGVISNPPYPLTPSDEISPTLPPSSQRHLHTSDSSQPHAFSAGSPEAAQKGDLDLDSDSEYSDNEWDQSDDEMSPEDVPNPLKIGGGKPVGASGSKTTLPDSLRVGPSKGIPIQQNLDRIAADHAGATASSLGAASTASGSSLPLQTNNPYLKMQHTGQSHFGAESSHQIWGDTASASQKYDEPAELPTMQTPTAPTHSMAGLKLDSHVPSVPSAKSPDQPPLIAVESGSPRSEQLRHEWTAPEPYAPGVDVTSLDAFERSFGVLQGPAETKLAQPSWQEQQAWESSERERRQQEEMSAQATATQAESRQRHEEEAHRMDSSSMAEPITVDSYSDKSAPRLPPRRSQDHQQVTIPLPPLDISATAPFSNGPESPNTIMTRQRKEHYQIKHIRWHDVNKQGTRVSPILTQNLNGPCPLLALVNALVLSTPSGVETALIETLRTREQVSLGLLLDAVFDELMSGRRGDAAQELPDVSELYRFLLALHTGLNVNPTFVRDADSTDGTRTIAPPLANRPGAFENTRDMKLYRTFDIPLMHGWLPEGGSDAYRAFERIAKTYETSQYVQFQEEELDAKLQTGNALTTEEQQMYADILAIKEYLSSWPTQLTDYGLKTIKESLKSGQVAILFRNDHFSTLCKDPRTNNLVTLVTDQGYSTHDEVVWESLVDVNGQGSELFSGDFRPVGNSSTTQAAASEQTSQSLLDVEDTEGWTTVASGRGRQGTAPPVESNAPAPATTTNAAPGLNRTEQEDHDLALALQLQEEEEDRHRRSQDEQRRRRENQLSENAIAANTRPGRNGNGNDSSNDNRPAIPPRRSNAPAVHRPNSEGTVPPPTYEEAATDPPYHPPQGHPANPGAPLRPVGSAYQTSSQSQPQLPPGRFGGRPQQMQGHVPGRYGGRRHSGAPVGGGPYSDADRDRCVVM